jgi:hypothetical protein
MIESQAIRCEGSQLQLSVEEDEDSKNSGNNSCFRLAFVRFRIDSPFDLIYFLYQPLHYPLVCKGNLLELVYYGKTARLFLAAVELSLTWQVELLSVET